MLTYTFDRTLDGLLCAVFDAFSLHQQPEALVGTGEPLPMFCEEVHHVVTAEDRAQRVWTGLEQRLSKEAVRMITVSYLSEQKELDTPLFHFICKVFQQPAGARSIERNFADSDVLYVRNTCRRVLHEQLRMKQFIRFQKAKDGTYLAVVSPDHNVVPLIIGHFQDRFGDQPWLIYDAKRKYGFYHDLQTVTRVTFQNETTLPFDPDSGKLNEDVLSENDKLFQDLWRTYFKAVCIQERTNPKKQLNDMPRRYWKYMTEKQ
ncbi:MAG: TIGR03915 family putative DNA repair protein [Bacteroidaceae bacterium]|nr:TIGR03915 family putative DNA repair protein [Bacteroidaceae bacterium]